MDCLRWNGRALPGLISAKRASWAPGTKLAGGTCDTYGLLIVREGLLFVKEAEREYEVAPGGILLLEPGIPREGFRACDEMTEGFEIAFRHDETPGKVRSDHISWHSPITIEGAAFGEGDGCCPLHLPKFGHFAIERLWETALEMSALQEGLTVASAIELQAAFARWLGELQSLVRESSAPNAQTRLAEETIAYLHEHMLEPLNLDGLAGALHYHKDHVTRCLKRVTGKTPHEYLGMIRIRRACSLLVDSPGLAVKEVAERSGYRDVNYFIRLFRKLKGTTPSEYRRLALRKSRFEDKTAFDS